ncbi:hypothetical protein HA40_12690 [Mixta calida]|nr:hypothetical protein HA40_12690 [Mixta calida]
MLFQQVAFQHPHFVNRVFTSYLAPDLRVKIFRLAQALSPVTVNPLSSVSTQNVRQDKDAGAALLRGVLYALLTPSCAVK